MAKLFILKQGCIQFDPENANIRVKIEWSLFRGHYIRLSWSERGRVYRNVQYYSYDSRESCENAVKAISDQL